jgi:hypothetical protein
MILQIGLTQSGTIASNEAKLERIYSKVLAFEFSNIDSCIYYSELFGKEFTSVISNNTNSLKHPFSLLLKKAYCKIQSSIDSKFRIYSWDTHLGGTMHFYKSVYQWQSNGKVYVSVSTNNEGDAGNYCSKIYSVKIKERLYYLAITNAVFSSKDAMQSISTYSIEANKLQDTAKVFKTSKQYLNSIDVSFDFFSVLDRPERPVELIRFDEKRKVVLIPVVDENGKVLKKHLVYALKEAYFQYVGIEADK